jgi:hypothetical protein
MPTLELTPNEVRVLGRALDIAVNYINNGIIGEFNLTPEETKVLKAKMQARSSEPIDWPPTDESLIKYLSSVFLPLEQQP